MLASKPRYIYPPRSDSCVPFTESSHYADLKMIAQLKYNDTRNLVSYGSGTHILWSRHKSPHKAFTPSDSLNSEIASLRSILGFSDDRWSYIDGGILDKKHHFIKQTMIVWDILVMNDEYLVDTTYESRYNMLASKCSEPYIVNVNGLTMDIGLKLTENIIVPRIINSDAWESTWNAINELNAKLGFIPGEKSTCGPLIEGFMFKDMKAKLEYSSKQVNNSSWNVRCRIETGRHAF